MGERKGLGYLTFFLSTLLLSCIAILLNGNSSQSVVPGLASLSPGNFL